MTGFIVLLLIGATAYLWNRSVRLERQLDALRDVANATAWRVEELARGKGEAAPADQSNTSPNKPVPAPDTAPAPDYVPGTVIPASRVLDEPEPKLTQPLEPTQPAPVQSEAAPLAAAPKAAERVTAPDPSPEPSDTIADEPELAPTSQFDFEDIFGRRLPIWAGGIALAIAGIFLVRYSIEAGLITPLVRVIASFAFGFGLIAGAETAYRFEERVKDDRVRQALAGAGIATLFGAFYLAGTSYGLIGATAAFIGLAAVTAAAIALSFRFGLPCAILGLVGGFAAPVLVDSDSANVPLLAMYLALVTGGLAWTGERQGRSWLAYTALAIGLGWGFLMQLSGLESSGDFAALGFYLIVLGTALPAFLAMRNGPSALQLAAAGIATLQMAVLVASTGFAPLNWGLYLLIGAALAGLGWRYPDLRAGSAIAGFVGFWLLALWPEPSPQFYALVAAVMAVLFAGMPLLYQWRGQATLLERAQITFMSLGIAAASYFHFGNLQAIAGPYGLTAGIAALAIFPLLAFLSRWRSGQTLTLRDDLPLMGAIHALLLVTAMMILPSWTAPLATAGLAMVLLALMARRAEELTLDIASWTAIAITIFALLLTPDFNSEVLRLGGEGSFTPLWVGLIRWAACCVPLLAMSALRPAGPSRPIADLLAACVAYGALAQVVPGDALAWLAAIAAIAVFTLREARAAGWGTFLAIAGLWTLIPLAEWFTAGALAVAGQPFLVDQAIAPIDLALRIAPFCIAVVVIGLRAKTLPQSARYVFLAASCALATIAVHSLYKLAWANASLFRFEWFGMGERTLWQAALLAAGLAAARFLTGDVGKRLRIGLIGAALLHFGWFTLLLHNPLHSVQHVGPTPIANWLTAAYAVAIAALVLLRGDASRLNPRMRPAIDTSIMALITLLAVSLLRQVFAGSVLTATSIGANESLLLSLLGIALAMGFLWWGSRVDQRTWRIGSLVLMLGAVLKVFLIDAAGLDGLLRVASFMALGFSLIGIGWVYTRQLRRRDAASGRLDQATG